MSYLFNYLFPMIRVITFDAFDFFRMGCLRILERARLMGDFLGLYKADILVMGNDWSGKFEECKNLYHVVYFSRRPEISTTSIKVYIASGLPHKEIGNVA